MYAAFEHYEELRGRSDGAADLAELVYCLYKEEILLRFPDKTSDYIDHRYDFFVEKKEEEGGMDQIGFMIVLVLSEKAKELKMDEEEFIIKKASDISGIEMSLLNISRSLQIIGDSVIQEDDDIIILAINGSREAMAEAVINKLDSAAREQERIEKSSSAEKVVGIVILLIVLVIFVSIIVIVLSKI